MIPYSSSIYNTITGSAYSPAIAVDLLLPEPAYLWSGTDQRTFDGKSYIGTGNLGKISAYQSDATLAANGLTLSISGIPVELLGIALNTNYQNCTAIIKLLVFNAQGNYQGSQVIFVGMIDSATIARDAETCTISLGVENHLITLDRPRITRYNNADQARIDPTDIGFEYVTKISQPMDFTWGSKVLTLRRDASANYEIFASSGGDLSYIPRGAINKVR
jgi:hypothetical protein